MEKIVVFMIEKQRYGMDIRNINSIERLPEITEIPQTPSFMKGVIHLRGNIIPIIDLKERLRMGASIVQPETRVIIVSVDDIQVGLLVDSATDVIDVDDSIIDSTIELTREKEQSYVKGVAKLEDELLVLLDVESLLQSDEISQVKKLVQEAE